MKKVEKLYPGAEETMYDVADMAWQNCENHIGRFQAFKYKYTPAYIAAAKNGIELAQLMPNINARRATLTNKRTKLVKAITAGSRYWQSLAAYIAGSFPPEEQDSMRKLAGGDSYSKASNKEWKGAETMLLMAAAFINKYIDDLKNGDMPETFVTAFNTKKAAFDAALKVYSDMKNDIQKDTSDKVTANNAVYATLQAMLKDAKAIFGDEPGLKKMFTYSALTKLVTKKSKGGFRITVRDEATKLPVTTATIVFQPGNKTAFVNENGMAEIFLPKDTYSYTLTAPGYPVAEGSLQAAGTMHRVEIAVAKALAVA